MCQAGKIEGGREYFLIKISFFYHSETYWIEKLAEEGDEEYYYDDY